MFNKLKQQLANINNTKKKKTPLEDLAERVIFLIFSNNIFLQKKNKGFDIDLSNLWKYSSQDLHTFITLYERHSEKLKKHFIGILKISHFLLKKHM